MGWNDYGRVRNGPCANCGREGGGFMSSSVWPHDYPCCSDRCGLRLGHKIKYGFVRGHTLKNPYDHEWPPEPSLQRLRIKALTHGVQRCNFMRPAHQTTRGFAGWRLAGTLGWMTAGDFDKRMNGQ